MLKTSLEKEAHDSCPVIPQADLVAKFVYWSSKAISLFQKVFANQAEATADHSIPLYMRLFQNNPIALESEFISWPLPRRAFHAACLLKKRLDA
jgi:hypothetical protein